MRSAFEGCRGLFTSHFTCKNILQKGAAKGRNRRDTIGCSELSPTARYHSTWHFATPWAEPRRPRPPLAYRSLGEARATPAAIATAPQVRNQCSPAWRRRRHGTTSPPGWRSLRPRSGALAFFHLSKGLGAARAGSGHRGRAADGGHRVTARARAAVQPPRPPPALGSRRPASRGVQTLLAVRAGAAEAQRPAERGHRGVLGLVVAQTLALFRDVSGHPHQTPPEGRAGVGVCAAGLPEPSKAVQRGGGAELVGDPGFDPGADQGQTEGPPVGPPRGQKSPHRVW